MGKIVRAYCRMGVCFAERFAQDDRVDWDGMHDEEEEAEGNAESELHNNPRERERERTTRHGLAMEAG